AAIAVLRDAVWGDREIRGRRGGPGDRMHEEMLGHELGAVTLGMIGLGNDGASVAHRMAAFGPRILFADARARENAASERVDLDTLFSQLTSCASTRPWTSIRRL